MNVPNKLAPAIALLLGVSAPVVHSAALPSGSLLQITDGIPTIDANGYQINVTSGSWFGMDTDGNSKIAGTEKTTLERGPDGGIIIGSAQSATGTHGGAPDGSENASIDAPWAFFGNTGLHFTTTAPVAIGDDTANGIDLSGWRVTWNAIPVINMGAGAWNPLNCVALDISNCSFSNGVAQLEWDGSDGGDFRLIYAATVPDGDPSGFGGVKYLLNLEGVVRLPVVPVPAAGTTLADGAKGGDATNAYRIQDLASAGITADADFARVGAVFDFSVTGVAGGVDVVLPAPSGIPEGAVYRKYTDAAGWFTFVEDGNNLLKSAASVGGACPAPGDAAYEDGLVTGHDCMQLTIQDGGSNDADGAANGTVVDPGGLAVSLREGTAADLSSGNSGCSIATGPVSITRSGDWLLIGGLLAGLGLYRRRRLS